MFSSIFYWPQPIFRVFVLTPLFLQRHAPCVIAHDGIVPRFELPLGSRNQFCNPTESRAEEVSEYFPNRLQNFHFFFIVDKHSTVMSLASVRSPVCLVISAQSEACLPS